MLNLHRLLWFSCSWGVRSPWDKAADKARACYSLKPVFLCKLLTLSPSISQTGVFTIRQHYVFALSGSKAGNYLRFWLSWDRSVLQTCLQPWMLPLLPVLIVLCVFFQIPCVLCFKSHLLCSWPPLLMKERACRGGRAEPLCRSAVGGSCGWTLGLGCRFLACKGQSLLNCCLLLSWGDKWDQSGALLQLDM